MQQSDSVLLLANRYSFQESATTDYAYKFYWDDGSDTTTGFGSIAELSKTVHFTN